MFLSGCSSVKVDEYANRAPKLDLRQYFTGPVEADGAFFGRNGKVEKQFHVAMQGSWNGNDGTLDEDFTYSDGSKSKRQWKIVMGTDGNFTGTAHDVVGQAIGRQSGNVSHMTYVLQLPKGGKTYNISMDDWMYKLSDTVMINRVNMSKFGFHVGELVITFKKK